MSGEWRTVKPDEQIPPNTEVLITLQTEWIPVLLRPSEWAIQQALNLSGKFVYISSLWNERGELEINAVSIAPQWQEAGVIPTAVIALLLGGLFVTLVVKDFRIKTPILDYETKTSFGGSAVLLGALAVVGVLLLAGRR